MAVCLKCNADYLPHVKVCPACNATLDAAPEGESGPLELVTIRKGWPAEIMAAQATLEASGIMARILDEHAAMLVPTFLMTLQVPAADVKTAMEVLNGKPPSP